jgi:hypothetical protein
MFRKTGRIAALAATLAAAGAFVAAAPALASCPPNLCLTPTFTNWPVTGTLTAGGQTTTLPSGGGFTGSGLIEIGAGGIEGTITGTVVIPPFTTPLELPLGSGNTQIAGITITQVGGVAGTLLSTNPALCGGNPTCVNLKVPTNTELEWEVTGAGNRTPVRCKTVTPVFLDLSTNLTLAQIVGVGSHFEGGTTIPAITCASKPGSKSNALSAQMTAALSGPGSYVLNINPPS